MQITMRNGFDRVIITLNTERKELPEFGRDAAGQPTIEMVEMDSYAVEVVGLYDTAHGARVGGTKLHTFRDRDEARGYANAWFAKLKSQGFARV